MEKLLKTDGYRISLARDESEAIENAQQKSPDLILVSLAGSPNDIIRAAERIREAACVGPRVPVVIFCLEGVDEGEEVAIDQNVHLTCPDNFNQLRGLMVRLLSDIRFAQTLDAADHKDLIAMNNINQKTLAARFLDTKPRVLLELSNDTNETLKSVEILAVFLKAEDSAGDFSEAQIKFDAVKSMPPKQTAVVSHRTWINGKPVNDELDQMAKLKVVTGKANPYVLHISWQDAHGKSRFQRIPVGH